MKRFILPGVLAVGLGAYLALAPRGVEEAELEVWHGARQRVGHLGEAQPDFNLMGTARANELLLRVNGGEPRALELGRGPFGFRRLGAEGHFNADIEVASLRPGENQLELIAVARRGEARTRVTLVRMAGGASPLPFAVDWSTVTDPQDVGQYVDGRWELAGGGLQSRAPLYDRLFLVGDVTWSDVDVRTSVTVHGVAAETGPHSGPPGVGLIVRFAGHVVDPPRFPEAQPKWGFQPLGAILWLRWKAGAEAPPVRQFYRGDENASEDGPALAPFTPGTEYALRALAETDPDDPRTTRYRLKIWPAAGDEPDAWDLDVAQTSDTALRRGGVALVAHHVDVTFGDIDVRVP